MILHSSFILSLFVSLVYAIPHHDKIARIPLSKRLLSHSHSHLSSSSNSPFKYLKAAKLKYKHSINPYSFLSLPNKQQQNDSSNINTSPLSKRTSLRQSYLTSSYSSTRYAHEALFNVGDLGFYGTVSVGEPPQYFTVLFDTGSADFFLPSTECQSEICSQHRRFNPLLSKTFDPLGLDPEGIPLSDINSSINNHLSDDDDDEYDYDQHMEQDFQVYKNGGFEIGYGTGNVRGRIGMDFVNIAGVKVMNIMGLGESLSNDFDGAPFDGILGLAYPSLSVIGQDPPFTTMIQDGALQQPIFSFWQDGTIGELLLGAIDQSKFHGILGYSSVVEQGYWMIDILGLSIDGYNLFSSYQEKEKFIQRRGIVDTGTTLLITTPQDAKIIHKFIHPNAILQTNIDQDEEQEQEEPDNNEDINSSSTLFSSGIYHIPCDISVLPTLHILLEGGEFLLYPKDYVLQPVSDGLCLSGIAGQKIGSSEWILGDVFLKNHYSVFDFGNNAVGFARRK